MKKRILIDASTLIDKVDGLANYIIYLIQFLPEEFYDSFDVSVLINPHLNNGLFFKTIAQKKIHVIRYKIAPIGPKRDWDMFWFLSKWRKKFELIHITSNTYPFFLKGGVCTIHDISFKKYFDQPKNSFGLATTYMDWTVRHCLASATKIIAVSASTRSELINQYKLTPGYNEKVEVIYEGWEHIQDAATSEICENEEFPLKNRYLFYLGTFRKHKNISGLISAFGKALPSLPNEIKLVLGGNSSHISSSDLLKIQKINIKGQRIVFTGYLSAAAVTLYYKHADAFVFPSFSEGFGFPVLEAFFHNCPVICSNTTSLPEVAGDAALFFDPNDISSITESLKKFYHDPQLAGQLRVKGKERLQQFSWASTAQQTAVLYQRVLAGNPAD